MDKFYKYAMVAMSLVLLVVSATNAFVNTWQNEKIMKLKDTLETVYAELDKAEDVCTNRDTRLWAVIKQMEEEEK